MELSLGIDFGTSSVRALVVNCANGAEIGSAVAEYPSGSQGVLVDPSDDKCARQNPADYFLCLEKAVKAAIQNAQGTSGFSSNKIIAIGVDSTGSSPIPVDSKNVALALHKEW